MQFTSKPLNKSALINLYNIGGKNLVLRMIDRFIESAPMRIEAARLQAKRHDLRALHLVAHSLKASAANVGVDRFRELVERLEEACLEQPDTIEEFIGLLEPSLHEAASRLRGERVEWV